MFTSNIKCLKKNTREFIQEQIDDGILSITQTDTHTFPLPIKLDKSYGNLPVTKCGCGCHRILNEIYHELECNILTKEILDQIHAEFKKSWNYNQPNLLNHQAYYVILYTSERYRDSESIVWSKNTEYFYEYKDICTKTNKSFYHRLDLINHINRFDELNLLDGLGNIDKKMVERTRQIIKEFEDDIDCREY